MPKSSIDTTTLPAQTGKRLDAVAGLRQQMATWALFEPFQDEIHIAVVVVDDQYLARAHHVMQHISLPTQRSPLPPGPEE